MQRIMDACMPICLVDLPCVCQFVTSWSGLCQNPIIFLGFRGHRFFEECQASAFHDIETCSSSTHNPKSSAVSFQLSIIVSIQTYLDTESFKVSLVIYGHR
jgi:hypothetical protein